jgi:hypothetical protein
MTDQPFVTGEYPMQPVRAMCPLTTEEAHDGR